MWILGLVWMFACLLPAINNYGLERVDAALSKITSWGLLEMLFLAAIPAELITLLLAAGIHSASKKRKLNVPQGVFIAAALVAAGYSYITSPPKINALSQLIGVNWYFLASTGANFFMLWTAINAITNTLYILRSPFLPKAVPQVVYVEQERVIRQPYPVPQPYPVQAPSSMPVWTQTLLSTVDPIEFEGLTARVFDNLGFQTDLTPMGGDGGVDVYAYKNGKKYVISCKCYNLTKALSPDAIRSLHSVAITELADEAFLVTSTRFSDNSRQLAARMYPRIYLIDGQQLADLLNAKPGATIYT